MAVMAYGSSTYLRCMQAGGVPVPHLCDDKGAAL